MAISEIIQLNKDSQKISESTNTRIPYKPEYKRQHNEKVYESEANTFIILGGTTENQPEKGIVNGSTITLCAGMGTAIKNEQVPPSSSVTLSPRFYYDSAVISVCEKVDNPDYNWGSRGWQDDFMTSENSSAIILKADELRMFARGGIKLVTRVDQYPSSEILNGTNPSHESREPVGISLVANDEHQTLQSMVKGQNLVNFLNEIITELERLNEIVHKIHVAQDKWNDALLLHTHISDFTVEPLLPPEYVDMETRKAHAEISTELAKWGTNKIWKLRINKLNNLRKTYLESAGISYINSRYNRTN